MSLRSTVSALALTLLAAPLALAADDLAGSWTVSGTISTTSRYAGTATVTQSASGAVEGRLRYDLLRYSWVTQRWVRTGRTGEATLRGRVVGDELVGVRLSRDGLAALAAPRSFPVRYRLARRSSPASNGSRYHALYGRYDGYSRSERLEGHVPPASTDPRAQWNARLKGELERAADGLLHMSETDAPFTWFQLDGAAGQTNSVAQLKAKLGVPADRPADSSTVDRVLGGWRADPTQPGDEPAAEAIRAAKYVELRRLLESNLTNLRVLRIGVDGSMMSGGDVMGGIDVYIIGDTPHGDVVGIKTFVAET